MTYKSQKSKIFRIISIIMLVIMSGNLISCQTSEVQPTQAFVSQPAECPSIPEIQNSEKNPVALEGRALDNLIAFTRLYGYVRYFHPSDEASQIDWDKFAMDGVLFVEDAPDTNALIQRLQTLFCPIAPTVLIYANGTEPQLSDNLILPRQQRHMNVVMWKHHGWGFGISSAYTSERISDVASKDYFPENFPDPQEPYHADLGSGISALVPLSLYSNEDGTLPKAPVDMVKSLPISGSANYSPSGKDRTTRLADIVITWTVIQHFYPYFDVVNTDWDNALRTSLAEAAISEDDLDFKFTLDRMMEKINDGHAGSVVGPDYIYENSNPLPINWAWIENKLVITHVLLSDTQLKPGDIVLAIDDEPVEDIIREVEARTSGATTQVKKYIALNKMINGDSPQVALRIQPFSGDEYTLTVSRTIPWEDWHNATYFKLPEKPSIFEIKPGIFYISAGRFTPDEFKEALENLKKAKGIIFDLREYPDNDRLASSFRVFSTTPLQGPKFLYPEIVSPDHQNMKFEDRTWWVQPSGDYFQTKTVLLIGANTVSAGETWAQIFSFNKMGDLVGEPTAGTNGDINQIKLPGNFTVTFTGLKTLNQDDSQFHGIGVQPTYPVSPTIQGIAEGRDEILDFAVNLLDK